jgi:uncharacterized membrane protein YkgB
MAISTDPGVIVAAILFLTTLTYIWKENIIVRFNIAIYLGAYLAIETVRNASALAEFSTKFTVNPGYILGFIFGISALLVISSRYRWVSRYGTSMMIGIGYGVSMGPLVVVTIIGQIQTAAGLLSSTDPTVLFGGIVSFIAMITTLFYFLFTVPRTGVLGGLRRVGRVFVMFMLGGFAATLVPWMFDNLILMSQRILWDFLGLFPG